MLIQFLSVSKTCQTFCILRCLCKSGISFGALIELGDEDFRDNFVKLGYEGSLLIFSHVFDRADLFCDGRSERIKTAFLREHVVSGAAFCVEFSDRGIALLGTLLLIFADLVKISVRIFQKSM